MIDVEMLRPTVDQMLSGLTADASMRKRICFKAGAVDMLPRVADEMLSGLTATPAMRHRILLVANREQVAESLSKPKSNPKHTSAYKRFMPAIGMAFVMSLMVWLGYLYGGDDSQPLPSPTVQSGMQTYAAGTAGTGIPQYNPLFAGQGVNPPVIAINGRFYRMLNEPMSVSGALRGEQLASVSIYTEEPSLVDPVGVISNIVQEGTPVYGVVGISFQTACIAEVNGSLRLFQRVGYASSSTIGNEMFEDTFKVQGMVQSLELSDVGIITDPNEANELIYLLYEYAEYHSNEIESGSQTLTVRLTNGLSLQLMVQDDLLSGCGVWACSEFFEQFSGKITQ